MASIEGLISSSRDRMRRYLDRRAHRSFRLTRRRDIPKRVKMPGYISFTNHVISTLWQYRVIFGRFIVIYILVAAALIGVAQQEQFVNFTDSLKTFGPEIFEGNFDAVTKTVIQFGAVITGGLAAPLSEVQQLNLALLGLFSWLTVVWLLRQLLAGNSARVRDGLYNAGAPFVSTLCVSFVLLLQLVPGALAVVAYIAAYSTGWLSGGVEAMTYAAAALLLVILSLYWSTSTFLAGIIVTLPGTYPMSAIKSAGDLAFGRRTTLLLRLLWLSFMLVLFWALLLVPALLIDGAVNVIWLPIVPVVVQLLTAVSVVFATSYTYLLYRKLIDGDTAA